MASDHLQPRPDPGLTPGARGYILMRTDSMRGRQMRKDLSAKCECDGCKLWFDEVREAHMFASLCRACSRRSAGARSR